MTDEQYMSEALKEAKKALKKGNWPIGCVIMLNGKIISRGHNQVYSSSNKLSHAEINALEKVQTLLLNNPNKAILYTTYEPCPMCFGACVLSRIKKVVCGIDLDRSGAMYFKEHLPLLFKQDKFQIDVKRGVLAKECQEIFLKGKPTKKLIKGGLLRIGQGSISV